MPLSKISATAMVLLGMTLFLLAGSAMAADPVSVVMRQAWITGGKYAPMYIALDKGWYAAQGLKPTIQRGHGSAAESKTLAAKQADYVFEVDTGTLIRARAAGAKIKEVGMVYGKYPVTLVSVIDPSTGRPRVATAKDLEGKSLAFSAGSMHDAMWPAFVKEAGIDKEKVKVVYMKGSEAYVPALLAGTVDAIFGFYSSEDAVAAVTANKMGKKLNFLSWAKVGPRFANFYSNGMIVRDEDIENRPKVVAAVVQETFRGFAYCMQHFNECVDVLHKYHPVLTREVSEMQLSQQLDAVQSLEAIENGLGFMRKDKMEYTTHMINEVFKHDPPVRAEDVYTNQFIKKIPLPADYAKWSQL